MIFMYGIISLLIYNNTVSQQLFQGFFTKGFKKLSTIGIIAEFNPFHLGHKHLIDTAKQRGDTVVCVMSGNYVQRGDTAIVPKAIRAKMAIDCGADLVAELPTPYCLSSSQNFAYGGVYILDALGCDGLLFGSECGDISKLEAAMRCICSSEFKARLPEFLSDGKSYAKAMAELLDESCAELKGILDNPNDALGIEYLYAIERIGSKMKPALIKRIGASHDSAQEDITASASLIRERLKAGDFDFIKRYMPPAAYNALALSPISSLESIEAAILARLRERALSLEIASLPDLSEGLENRLVKAIKQSRSLQELYSNIKTKRYTLARIRRLVLSAYLGLDASFIGSPPPYIRILGFSAKGQEVLSLAKKSCDIPIITNTADIKALPPKAMAAFQKENLYTDIYSLTLNKPEVMGIEYYQKLYKGEF